MYATCHSLPTVIKYPHLGNEFFFKKKNIYGTGLLLLWCTKLQNYLPNHKRHKWRMWHKRIGIHRYVNVSTVNLLRDAPFDFWGGGPRLFLKKNVCFQISVKKNICWKLVHKKIICWKIVPKKIVDNFNCWLFLKRLIKVEFKIND